MNWMKTKNNKPPTRTMLLFHSVDEGCELMGIYNPANNSFMSRSVKYYADNVPYWCEITDPTENENKPDMFGVYGLIDHERKRCEHKNNQIRLLWKLLDDISTAGDIYKPDSDDGYAPMVNLLCNKRSSVANSFDGKTLTIKEYFE